MDSCRDRLASGSGLSAAAKDGAIPQKDGEAEEEVSLPLGFPKVAVRAYTQTSKSCSASIRKYEGPLLGDCSDDAKPVDQPYMARNTSSTSSSSTWIERRLSYGTKGSTQGVALRAASFGGDSGRPPQASPSEFHPASSRQQVPASARLQPRKSTCVSPDCIEQPDRNTLQPHCTKPHCVVCGVFSPKEGPHIPYLQQQLHPDGSFAKIPHDSLCASSPSPENATLGVPAALLPPLEEDNPNAKEQDVEAECCGAPQSVMLAMMLFVSLQIVFNVDNGIVPAVLPQLWEEYHIADSQQGLQFPSFRSDTASFPPSDAAPDLCVCLARHLVDALCLSGARLHAPVLPPQSVCVFPPLFFVRPWHAGLLGALPYVGTALMSPLNSRLLNALLPKCFLCICLCCNTAACCLFAMAPGGPWLLTARLLVGATQAPFFIYAPVWIDAFAPQQQLTLWLGFLQGAVVLGIMLLDTAAQHEKQRVRLEQQKQQQPAQEKHEEDDEQEARGGGKEQSSAGLCSHHEEDAEAERQQQHPQEVEEGAEETPTKERLPSCTIPLACMPRGLEPLTVVDSGGRINPAPPATRLAAAKGGSFSSQTPKGCLCTVAVGTDGSPSTIQHTQPPHQHFVSSSTPSNLMSKSFLGNSLVYPLMPSLTTVLQEPQRVAQTPTVGSTPQLPKQEAERQHWQKPAGRSASLYTRMLEERRLVVAQQTPASAAGPVGASSAAKSFCHRCSASPSHASPLAPAVSQRQHQEPNAHQRTGCSVPLSQPLTVLEAEAFAVAPAAAYAPSGDAAHAESCSPFARPKSLLDMPQSPQRRHCPANATGFVAYTAALAAKTTRFSLSMPHSDTRNSLHESQNVVLVEKASSNSGSLGGSLRPPRNSSSGDCDEHRSSCAKKGEALQKWLFFHAKVLVRGGILPPATGLVLACVPPERRTDASGFAIFVYTVFGYMLGSFLPGVLNDLLGLAAGMRISLLWSVFGFFTFVAATVFTWRQQSAFLEGPLERPAEGPSEDIAEEAAENPPPTS
ncbi:hypothetical protein cyc_08816 [Cyclospora cayetanensis]|uniref:Major facilitator family protein n=1 Tax=Cyclospora cayetanensis TaxID=88456 RepID=A0A1D3DB04_9EIME|nr:hypothetical protein cyc_08816 [Cyclospora cayetanensis]